MASFDPLHPLYSHIIESVAEVRSLSFDQLKEKLVSTGSAESSATLYRRVGELIEEQVLLRYKRKLSLNLVWVSHILRFSDVLRQNYADSSKIVDLPRREGEYRDYKAGSLAALDPLWNNIHIELGMRFGERIWYGYNSRPWYQLGMPKTEQRLQESFVANGYQYYLLYGNDSALDRFGAKLFQVSGFSQAFGQPKEFRPHDQGIWAAGQYTLECIFPKKITDSFNDFFLKRDAVKSFSQSDFAAVFKMKAPCKLRVKKSRRDADRIRNIIAPYFY